MTTASAHLVFLTLLVLVAARYWKSVLKSFIQHMMIPTCSGMALDL